VTAAAGGGRPAWRSWHSIRGPAARTALSVAVVLAIFLGVLPRIADYSEAWQHILALTWLETASLLVLTLVNLVTYAIVAVVTLPGLRLGRALLVQQASTAVANTVPAGFAVGAGTTFGLYSSYGFAPAASSRALLLTGLANTAVKLAMPALALAVLALSSEVTGGLAAASGLGAALLAVALVALVRFLRHEGSAAALARVAERVTDPLRRLVGGRRGSAWAEQAERYRADSLDLLRERWASLSVTLVLSHVALYLVLLAAVRHVGGGDGVSWAQVLAVFTVTRLVTLIPITPGALGVAELSYVAGLTALGMDAAAATGAVLVFRALTWFLPIPLGVAAWLLWRADMMRPTASTHRSSAADPG
jgi:putative heme transporter